MKVEIERTREDRITNMYVLKLPPVRTRFVCFTHKEWEEKFPHIVLGRGEKIFAELTLTTEKKEV